MSRNCTPPPTKMGDRIAPDFVHELQTMVERLRAALQADRVTVRLDPDRDFPVIAEATADGVDSIRNERSFPQSTAATVKWVAREKKILIVPDVRISQLKPPPAMMSAYELRAFMIAPLIIGDSLAGTVSVHQSCNPRNWTPSEVSLLSNVAAEVRQRVIANRSMAKQHTSPRSQP